MPRVLLTRPRDRSEALASDLVAAGWDALIWPLLTIKPLLNHPPQIAADETVVFTSARGVEVSSGLPENQPVVCVGPATAEAARAEGLEAEHADGDVETLLAHLIASDRDNFVHIHGEESRGDLTNRLKLAGRRARDIVAYRAEPTRDVPADVNRALSDGDITSVALFSPRTASIFAGLVRSDWGIASPSLSFICISEATATPIRALGFGDVVIAEAPNGTAMRAAICGAATKE